MDKNELEKLAKRLVDHAYEHGNAGLNTSIMKIGKITNASYPNEFSVYKSMLSGDRETDYDTVGSHLDELCGDLGI